jgi:ribonuclease P/MRP protein subunit RPP40
LPPITETLIKKKISKLKANSSPGPDGIGPKLLQGTKEEICKPLCILYKQSLSLGQVPLDWKRANITPIWKKGPKTFAGNYRPINLVSIIVKILESLLKDAMIKYLRTHRLLRASQHGFVPGKSCLTNLLEYYEFVTSKVDQGEPVDSIYLDFSRAFDKVAHARLMKKIRNYGFHSKICDWIESWLSGRQQRVVINGKCSDWIDVISSVVQGSVLGPLLFVIFIDDLDEWVFPLSIPFKFADDTKLTRSLKSHDDANRLQEALDRAVDWANLWQMTFNVDKCCVIHFGNSNPNTVYKMEGSDLKCVEEEKDLGVLTNKSLKPKSNCAKAAKKANGILGQMKRTFTFSDRSILIRLYVMYIRPHLEYAVQSWCPWTEEDIDLLESVQKRFVRMLPGLSGSYKEKLAVIGLQTLNERRGRGDAIETFKILKGFYDVDSKIWFKSAWRESGASTRHSNAVDALQTQFCRLDLRKNFFTYRATVIWNALPSSLREAKTVNQFKSLYDKHYFQSHTI